MSTACSRLNISSNQYDSLVRRLRKNDLHGNSRQAPAISVVSYASGAGVSAITNALIAKMNLSAKSTRIAETTVSFSTKEIEQISGSNEAFLSRLCERYASRLDGVYSTANEVPLLPVHDSPDPGSRFEDILSAARGMFHYVFVECQALECSSDIGTVAPLVDGVLIVIEANKTTRIQTDRLMHAIHTAGGKVLGFVLNKQTFPIPDSIYRICEKRGVI